MNKHHSPSLGVVVTNYNTQDLLLKCLHQCEHLEPSLSDIVVVDDASDIIPDLSGTKARLIRNESNIGLVGSLNRGIESCRADLVVVFDADAHPLSPFSFEILAAFSDDPNLAMAAFRTVDSKGCPTASSQQEPGFLTILLGQALHAKIEHLVPKRPLCIFTCAMVVRKTAFEEAGGFDARFDWLDLDLDLSMQFTRMGRKLKIIENLMAFHVGGGTPQAMEARVRRFYLNRWLLLKKYHLIPMPAVIRSLIVIRLFVEWIFLLLAGSHFFPREVALKKACGRIAIINDFISLRSL